MHVEPPTQPLSQRHRQFTFLLLLGLFLAVIPFLYLYATGYRFDFGGRTNFISTGGIFIAAERTGAEIFIDNELVRETRVFRRAFYAQNLDPGTHRVHVQRPGSHTWVKELPVYAHLVTEAQAFNLPIVPIARVLTEWNTVDGAVVVPAAYTLRATTTQDILVATTTATTTYVGNTEFTFRKELFTDTPATTTPSVAVRAAQLLTGKATTTATTTEEVATTTKVTSGVKLSQHGEDVFATWVGTPEEMPYYYCAEAFPPYVPASSTTEETSATIDTQQTAALAAGVVGAEHDVVLDNPVQQVPEDVACVPEIRIDRKWQKVESFDFFPGSTDLVIMALEHGIYVVEIDDRSWQNVQPIMEGDGLEMRIDGGRVYVYDGSFIYEMVLEQNTLSF